MTTDNLRILVRDVFERTNDVEEIKRSIFSLIRLFEMTYNPDSIFIKDRYEYKETNYLNINCGCKPENGGNGICGSTIGSVMELMQKKYEGTIKSDTTTYSDTLSCGFGICNCTSESNYTYCLTSTKTTI